MDHNIDSIDGDSLLVTLGSNISRLVHANSYQCQFCDKSFLYACDLSVHQKMHRNEKQYNCPSCSLSFKSRNLYYNHRLTHLDIKPHSCSYCGKVFNCKSSLVRHVRTHTGEKPFKCTYCDAVFNTKDIARNHERRKHHTLEMQFYCQECGKKFLTKLGLLNHLRLGDSQHTGDELCACHDCITKYEPCLSSGKLTYTCKGCAGLYETTCSLKRHLIKVCSLRRCRTGRLNCLCVICIRQCQHSSPSGSTWFVCPDCKCLFSTARSLEYHFKKRQLDDCMICKQVFCSEWHQLCHAARVHGNGTKVSPTENVATNDRCRSDELVYLCMYCLKAFAVPDELLLHTRSHIEGRPYECMHCIRTFRSIVALRTHEVIHMIEKPYICWCCKREFAVRNELLSHIQECKCGNFHKCSSCDKSFSNSRRLLEHESRLHRGLTYLCPNCGRVFVYESSLAKHVSKAHKVVKLNKFRHCNEDFRAVRNRASHEKSKHRTLVCELCDETFSSYGQKNVHMFMHANM